jgi:hypothetical protein
VVRESEILLGWGVVSVVADEEGFSTGLEVVLVFTSSAHDLGFAEATGSESSVAVSTGSIIS